MGGSPRAETQIRHLGKAFLAQLHVETAPLFQKVFQEHSEVTGPPGGLWVPAHQVEPGSSPGRWRAQTKPRPCSEICTALTLSPRIHPRQGEEIKNPRQRLALYSLIWALRAWGTSRSLPGRLISCPLTCMT